ncbi:MAG TPA: hypothetical protein VLA93_15635 [Pyrinomonadaceae bacterium]|nr:hypothetical protein [Pyrinomonadaceae bacterium]
MDTKLHHSRENNKIVWIELRPYSPDASRAILSVVEMLELIELVNGYGENGDGIPYAEKAVELYPESARALVVLAGLIRNRKERGTTCVVPCS